MIHKHDWSLEMSTYKFTCNSCGAEMGPDIKDLDIAKLRAENARLRAVLEAVEWFETDLLDYCPWCTGWKPDYDHLLQNDSYNKQAGHKPDCPRQLALKGEPQP